MKRPLDCSIQNGMDDKDYLLESVMMMIPLMMMKMIMTTMMNSAVTYVDTVIFKSALPTQKRSIYCKIVFITSS